jgi:hypothetical protein
MAFGVQPIQLGYSFVANRQQATDTVDLTQLDAAFAQVADKINEIITALDVTLRDDNTLDDGTVEPRNLSEDVHVELTALVNGAIATDSA